MPETQAVAGSNVAKANCARPSRSPEPQRSSEPQRDGVAGPSVAPDSLTDADLVGGILLADDACFNVLYERYFNRVYAYSFRRLRNQSDAEEVTQETFLTVFKSMSNFRGQSTLLSWIFGITRNLSNNSMRRFQGQREKFESISPDHFVPKSSFGNFAPDDDLSMQRYLGTIQAEMDALPSWQRRIFEMRHLEDMSISEISEQTNRSSDAVRSSLYRVKRMMCEAVDSGVEVSFR